jgi:hypothetical protein
LRKVFKEETLGLDFLFAAWQVGEKEGWWREEIVKDKAALWSGPSF